MNIFLFGNGKSRQEFELDTLKGKGLLVGCNWSYRDYPYDIICSADREVSAKIEKEWKGDWIRRDDYSNKNNHRDNVYWNTHDKLLYTLPQMGNAIGWNTGRAAIYTLSRKYTPSTIYLLGFDLNRTNVHPEAGMEHRWNTAPDNFVAGWNALINHPEVSNIVRVGPVDGMTARLNCTHITYEEFNKKLEQGEL